MCGSCFMSRMLLECGSGYRADLFGCTQRKSMLSTDGMCGSFRPVLTAQDIGDQIRNGLLKKGVSRFNQNKNAGYWAKCGEQLKLPIGCLSVSCEFALK